MSEKQVRIITKAVCPTPIIDYYRDGTRHPIGCGRWPCPVCSKRMKFNLIKRFEHNKKPGNYNMVSLTEWKHPDNYENAIHLMDHWNSLKSAVKRHNVVINDYFGFKEYKPLYNPNPNFTDDENAILYPHSHILIHEKIKLSLMQRLWYKITGYTSYHVDIKIPKADDPEIRNPTAYATKYITKSDMQKGFHKNERRYIASRNYKVEKDPFMYKNSKNTVKVWEPYRPDGLGITVFHRQKATDEELSLIERVKEKFINEYNIKNPKNKAVEYSQYLDDCTHINENRIENIIPLIEEMLLESDERKGDQLLTPYYPGKMKNPAVQYADEKVKFLLRRLKNEKLLKDHNHTCGVGAGGPRDAAKEAKEELDYE